MATGQGWQLGNHQPGVPLLWSLQRRPGNPFNFSLKKSLKYNHMPLVSSPRNLFCWFPSWRTLHFLSLHIKALLQQLGVRIEQSSPASEVGDKDKDGKGESYLASQSSFSAWTDNSQSAFSTSSDLEPVESNLNRTKQGNLIKSVFRYSQKLFMSRRRF